MKSTPAFVVAVVGMLAAGLVAPAIIPAGGAHASGGREAVRFGGMALEWTQFIGGSRLDQASAIALDGDGRLHLAGITGSSDFPTSPDAFCTAHSGGFDMFLMELNTRQPAIAFPDLAAPQKTVQVRDV